MIFPELELFPELTVRQYAVLETMIQCGFDTSIASRLLEVSSRTIRAHIVDIKNLLHCHSKYELVTIYQDRKSDKLVSSILDKIDDISLRVSELESVILIK
jgi:DNA-binding NarL/FixJ family response regulator